MQKDRQTAHLAGNNVVDIQAGEQPSLLPSQQSNPVIWDVRRDGHADVGTHRRKDDAKKLRRHREWGGEANYRTYYTTAAVQMLVKGLGPELGKFLEAADGADLCKIMTQLRHIHAATERAKASARASKRQTHDSKDEPLLPFENDAAM